jgi:thioredoxin-like negative regulator of GroEL
MIVRFVSLMRGKGEPALAAKLLVPFESRIDGDPVLLAEWLQQQLAAGRGQEAFERLDGLRRKKLLSGDLTEPFIDLALAEGDLSVAIDAAQEFGFSRLKEPVIAMLTERALAGQAAIASRIAVAAGEAFLDTHRVIAARLALARGDWPETTRRLKDAENDTSLSGADRFAIAGLDVSLGRQLEAAAQLARIPIESQPDDLLLEIARTYVAIGKAGEGAQRFDRIRAGKSTGALDRAWALVAAACGRGKDVARWMRLAPAQSIPEPLLNDLFYLAQDNKQPELEAAASQRLFREHADDAHRLMLANALNTAGQPLAALPHARALLQSNEPGAEDIYTAALLGAIHGTSAGGADGFKKELRTFWTRKLSQAGPDERKQLDLIYGLLDIGAWDAALPPLEKLARRREDLAPLFIETAIKADNRKAAVAFLEADLIRTDLSEEKREARVYALIDSGGQAEALPYMHQLAAAGVPNWDVTYEEALQKLGRSNELLDFWRDRLADAGTSSDEKRGIAYKLIDAGKPESARTVFAGLAATAPPDSPDVAEWLFLSGQKPGKEALDLIESRARHADSGDRPGWLNRLLEAGAPERVVAIVSANPPHAGDGGPLFDIYIRALAARNETDVIATAIAREAGAVEDRDRVRKLAALALETGGSAAAEPAYERLAALDPSDPEALHRLGVFAYGHARYSVAARHLDALLASSEGGYDDNFYFAEILWREGKRSQARAYYGRALRLIERLPSPTAEAHAAHAQALFRSGYMDRALREYRTLIADEPRNGDLRADFAAMLLEASKYDEADDVLSSSVDSGGARMALLHAQLLSDTGHLPDAIKAIQSLDDGNLHLANVAAALGALEQTAGRDRRALTLLDRAAVTDPGNEDFRDALAGIEKARAGQLGEETEYRRIQGTQGENIVRLQGQSVISPALRVIFSAEQDRVSIRNLQKIDGSRGAFEGIERRGEAALEWESEGGTRVRGSLFSGDSARASDSSYGGGAMLVQPDLKGSTTVQLELRRPDWDFAESLAQGGVRDRVEVRQESSINSRTSVRLGVAANRYDLPGITGAAKSVSATGDVSVKLFRKPGISLDYSVDAEYRLNAKPSQPQDGSSFLPLPLVSREVHAGSVQFERQLARGLHAAGSAGFSADRLGGRAPFWSGSVTYDRFRHFGAQVNYDRRFYKYDSSQVLTTMQGGVFWIF